MARKPYLPPDQNRIHVDLAVIGLPEVPLLGVHDEKYARQGLAPHVHPGLMDICYLKAPRSAATRAFVEAIFRFLNILC